MKIKARIIYDGNEKIFFIPCGTGDKCFKWLGIVASQRYSTATPNGSLRRREDFCAMSEKAQYQTLNMVLPSGETPHPQELINEYLREGDVVVITLCSKVTINNTSGSPNQSNWVSLAYSTSTENLHILGINEEDSVDANDADGGEVSTEEKLLIIKEAQVLAKSNARFMRIVLQSQMINTKRIESEVAVKWSRVAKLVPILPAEESSKIQEVFCTHWCKLVDLYECHQHEGGGCMTKEDFLALMEDADVFRVHKREYSSLEAMNQAVALAASQTNKIFTRTCKYLNISAHEFDMSSFLVALILVAQAKHNDTMVCTETHKKSCDALNEICVHDFNPLARRLQLASVLKEDFVSDECLSKLRGVYNELQAIFDKIAAKFRDMPTTIPVKETTMVLVNAGLILLKDEEKQQLKTAALHKEVREGVVYGRSIEQSGGDSSYEDDEELSDDEFTFPEFIEMIARAGYHRYYTREIGGDANDGTECPSIIECYLKAFNAVADGTNHQAVSQQKSAPGTAKPRYTTKK